MPQASMPQGTRPPALSEAIYVALEPPLLLEAQHIAAIAVPDIRDDVFASAAVKIISVPQFMSWNIH